MADYGTTGNEQLADTLAKKGRWKIEGGKPVSYIAINLAKSRLTERGKLKQWSKVCKRIFESTICGTAFTATEDDPNPLLIASSAYTRTRRGEVIYNGMRVRGTVCTSGFSWHAGRRSNSVCPKCGGADNTRNFF